jgi:iron complex outermembrane receptor protein
MKNLLAVALTIFIAISANAQLGIYGHVKDSKTKEALIGASLVIKGSYLGSNTNTEGYFTIENLKKGNYKLLVSYLGYEKKEIDVSLSANKEIEIFLEPKTYLEDEIIISATRAKENTPTTFTNLDKVELEKQYFGQDIPILLNTVPSVVTTSDAGTGIGYTGLRIRGTDQSRINVTLNGIPYNDAESHGVFWVNLPDFTSSIENIQIQRGVGTSTNGAAAFGGSINIQTNKLYSEPYAEISNSFGSFNTRKHTVKAGTGLIEDKFTFDARLSQIHSDGFIDRAFSDLKSYYLSGAYYGEKDIIRLNIFSGHERTYQSWGGVPASILETNRTYNQYTYEDQVDNYNQSHYQLHFTHQFSENFYANLSLHYTHGEGYFEEFQDTLDPYAQTDLNYYGLYKPLNFKGDSVKSNIIRRKWLENDFYGVVYSLNYNLDNFKFKFGGSYNEYDGNHFGKVIWANYFVGAQKGHEWYRAKGFKTDLNNFLKVDYALNEKINLFVDLQHRMVSHEIKGTEDVYGNVDQLHEYNFFNPKAGIFAKVNQHHQLYASFAISNREPNRNIFLDHSNETSPPSHETLNDIEIGHNLVFKKFLINTNLYYMLYKNQLVPTGEVNLVGYPLARNVDKSFRRGIEIVFQAKPFDKFEWGGNLSLSQNKIKNYTEKVDEYDANWNWIGQKSTDMGETDIAFSPSVIASNQFSYSIFQNLRLSLNSKYVGKQFIDNTSSDARALDAFMVHNFQIDYSIKTQYIPEIYVFLTVNNILDEEYEPNAWIYAYYLGGTPAEDIGYYPQAGTNVFGGLTLKF